MLRWNIDFFAVLFIAVVMFGFSKMPSLRLSPDAMDSIQIQNAVSGDADSCANEVIARIANILNQ